MLKSRFCFLLLFFFIPLSTASAQIEGPNLSVVTSFSILEDLVRQLGGEHVTVVNLVDRNSDAHTYRPVPSDAAAIQNADLVVFNGLGFEGWIERLLENKGQRTSALEASRGIDVITINGEVDPHAWQSFTNVRLYIDNISQRLIDLLPVHRDSLIQRQLAYLEALKGLEAELVAQIAAIPHQARIVVTSHDAFLYLGRELDIQFLAPLGLSYEAEASAEDVALVVDQIRERNVTALFLENINNPRLLNSIADESGVEIGGRLYSDALSKPDGPAGTYLEMMRHNIESLAQAFSSNTPTTVQKLSKQRDSLSYKTGKENDKP